MKRAPEIICKLVTTEQERTEAFDLRRKVFTEEQGVPETIVFDEEDNTCLHIIAREGLSTVGTARIRLLADNQAKVERMAVSLSDRRRSIGKQIMQFIDTEMKKRRIKQIILHAQYHVTGFYQSCGYRQTGKPFQEAGIKHIEMQKEL